MFFSSSFSKKESEPASLKTKLEPANVAMLSDAQIESMGEQELKQLLESNAARIASLTQNLQTLKVRVLRVLFPADFQTQARELYADTSDVTRQSINRR